MSKCEDCGKGNHNKRTTCWNCGSTRLVIKQKVFDRDAVYAKVLKTYIKKGKTVIEANEIAQKVVSEQQKIWTDKKLFSF